MSDRIGDQIDDEFGRLLNLFIRKSGMTMAQAAQRLGLSRSTLYNWVIGERKPRESRPIREIARVLSLSVEDTDRLLKAAGYDSESPSLPIVAEAAMRVAGSVQNHYYVENSSVEEQVRLLTEIAASLRDISTRLSRLEQVILRTPQATESQSEEVVPSASQVSPVRIPKRPATIRRWRRTYDAAKPFIRAGLNVSEIAGKLGIPANTLGPQLIWGEWDELQRNQGEV